MDNEIPVQSKMNGSARVNNSKFSRGFAKP